MKSLTGADGSAEMLRLANLVRRPAGALLLQDLLGEPLPRADAAVCVRFLDLLPAASARAMLGRLCAAARQRVIYTVRLGPRTVEKSNTTTHSASAWSREIRRLGWRVERDETIGNAGWHVTMIVLRSGERG